MTTSQIIKTIIELLLIILLFVGIKYEYKLINFENKIKEKIKRFLAKVL